jgi:hypothetical protein
LILSSPSHPKWPRWARHIACPAATTAWLALAGLTLTACGGGDADSDASSPAPVNESALECERLAYPCTWSQVDRAHRAQRRTGPGAGRAPRRRRLHRRCRRLAAHPGHARRAGFRRHEDPLPPSRQPRGSGRRRRARLEAPHQPRGRPSGRRGRGALAACRVGGGSSGTRHRRHAPATRHPPGREEAQCPGAVDLGPRAPLHACR